MSTSFKEMKFFAQLTAEKLVWTHLSPRLNYP